MSTLDTDTVPIWERLCQVWPEFDWINCRIVHGAFHHAAVLGSTAAIRVATGIAHEPRSRREMENLETITLKNFASRIRNNTLYDPNPAVAE